MSSRISLQPVFAQRRTEPTSRSGPVIWRGLRGLEEPIRIAVCSFRWKLSVRWKVKTSPLWTRAVLNS
jgi:hypothetical protein